MDPMTLALIKKLGGSGGGGGGGVSSWNDLTDKPFEVIGTTETTIIAEQEMPYSGGVYMLEGETTASVSLGDTLKIVLDGTTYNGVVSFNETMSAFVCGNLAIMGVGDDTGEPFLFADIPPMVVAVAAGSEGETHTIGIYGIAEDIKKLDEKYIPGALLPDADSVGQIARFNGAGWTAASDPTQWEFIDYSSPAAGGSLAGVVLKKNYKKLLIVSVGVIASGTADQDIYITTNDIKISTSLTYEQYGLATLKGAARANSNAAANSYCIIEKMPTSNVPGLLGGAKTLCIASKTPAVFSGNGACDLDVLMTVSKVNLDVDPEYGTRHLTFCLFGNATYAAGGNIQVWGIPE